MTELVEGLPADTNANQIYSAARAGLGQLVAQDKEEDRAHQAVAKAAIAVAKAAAAKAAKRALEAAPQAKSKATKSAPQQWLRPRQQRPNHPSRLIRASCAASALLT